MARVALLVGIRDHTSDLEQLPASPGDVESLRDILLKKECCRFHRVQTLADTLADGANTPAVSRPIFEDKLEQWCFEHELEDVALLYISGHLLWDDDGEVYLATNETACYEGKFRHSSAVSGTFIRRCLDQSVAQVQIVILDCCLQPAAFNLCGVRESQPCAPLPDLNRCLGGDRRIILTSSDNGSYSPGQKRGEVSLYTQYFMEGIFSGLADRDGNQTISLEDIHAYVTQKLSIAAPAIAPKLLTPSNNWAQQLRSRPIARSKVSTAQRRYYDAVIQFIERHRGTISDINQKTLKALQENLRLNDDCVHVLWKIAISPYHVRESSIQQYHEHASQLVEREALTYADICVRLENIRHRLGLTSAWVDSVNKNLQCWHQLRQSGQYRGTVTDTLAKEPILNETTQRDLEDFRQILGISEQEAALINPEIEFYRSIYQQRLNQYRVKFQQAIQSGVAKNPLVREELDNFQQSLGLSNRDIELIEQQVQWAMTDSTDAQNGYHAQNDSLPCKGQPHNSRSHNDRSHNGQHSTTRPANAKPANARPANESYEGNGVNNGSGVNDGGRVNNGSDRPQALQQFEQAFSEAADRQIPLTPGDAQALADLQAELGLTDEMVKPIKARVIETIKAKEHDYQEKLSLLERAYREEASKRFPLSPESHSWLNTFQERLHIREQDFRQIAERIRYEWEHRGHSEQQDGEQQDNTSSETSGTHGEPDHAGIVTNLQNLDEASEGEQRSPGSHPSQDSALHGQMTSDDELASAQQIDYRTLQHLLRNHQWAEADNETFGILLTLVKSHLHDAEWLDAEAIATLPCTDLKTIDRLWSRYSEGKFGLRIQCGIYFDMTTGSSSVRNYSTTFGRRVGWVLWDNEFMGFKPYNQLNFNHLSAPNGHLPARWFWKIPWQESLRCGGLVPGRGGCGHDGGVLFAFMKRLVNCKMNDHE